MKPLFRVMSVYATTVMVLVSFNIADAETQKPSIGNEQIEDLNKQLKRIDASIKKISKHSKSTRDLTTLQKAEKAGLSKVIKAMSAEGGRYEIQSDGAIKIIPSDRSITKKIVKKTQAKTTKSASSVKSKNKISKKDREIIKRLQKANKRGLPDLLNKLSADGGDFQLIENGGIRITPKNATKAKELARKLQTASSRTSSLGKVTSVAKKWLKDKNKTALSIGKIRRIKWLYLVSIVTDKGNMDTQLVIRASDGKTVAYTKNTFEVFN